MRVRSFVLAILLAISAATPALGVGPVLLVRHAEKLAEGPDPGLSSTGRARADALAALLADAGVRHVFSTDYRRTRETVEPLARALGLEVELYDPRDLSGLVERLGALEGISLVVGHSNTTTAVVELLGGEPGPPIDDAGEFDRLYVVRADSCGPAETVLMRYGGR